MVSLLTLPAWWTNGKMNLCGLQRTVYFSIDLKKLKRTVRKTGRLVPTSGFPVMR
jgi:hypothetical protein